MAGRYSTLKGQAQIVSQKNMVASGSDESFPSALQWHEAVVSKLFMKSEWHDHLGPNSNMLICLILYVILSLIVVVVPKCFLKSAKPAHFQSHLQQPKSSSKKQHVTRPNKHVTPQWQVHQTTLFTTYRWLPLSPWWQSGSVFMSKHRK